MSLITLAALAPSEVGLDETRQDLGRTPRSEARRGSEDVRDFLEAVEDLSEALTRLRRAVEPDTGSRVH